MSARWTHREHDPLVLVPTLAIAEQGQLPIPALQHDSLYYQTGQLMKNAWKRKRQTELPRNKERSRASVTMYRGDCLQQTTSLTTALRWIKGDCEALADVCTLLSAILVT